MPNFKTIVQLYKEFYESFQIFHDCVFSASVNFKAFFDEYFVVKSHLHVQKFFVEFNDVSKTGLTSKIRTP